VPNHQSGGYTHWLPVTKFINFKPTLLTSEVQTASEFCVLGQRSQNLSWSQSVVELIPSSQVQKIIPCIIVTSYLVETFCQPGVPWLEKVTFQQDSAAHRTCDGADSGVCVSTLNIRLTVITTTQQAQTAQTLVRTTPEESADSSRIWSTVSTTLSSILSKNATVCVCSWNVGHWSVWTNTLCLVNNFSVLKTSVLWCNVYIPETTQGRLLKCASFVD